MGVVRWVEQRLWDGGLDVELRPVALVTIFSSIAGSTLWSFMAIWAVDELDQKALLGPVFAVGSVLAMGSGYLGGWLSDRVGRRRVILFGQGTMIGFPLLLLAASGNPQLAVWLLCLAGVFGSLGGSVAQAMIADLVHPERHESAYASVRVAANFGVILGPPMGGVLLQMKDWNALFIGVTLLSAAAWLFAFRFLPSGGAYAHDGPPERSSLGTIFGDRPFLLFLGSAVFAWLVYVVYEIVLPVSIVDGYGYAKETWGWLVWINPFLVALLQVRLTRWTANVAAPVRLIVGLLMMGLPFTLLLFSQSFPTLVVVIVLFVFGEMLWVPTSQTVVARLAPPDIRGAYMGIFGSAAAVGFALTPLIGFQLRNSYGDDTMWLVFVAISIVAAALGALALVGLRDRHYDDDSSLGDGIGIGVALDTTDVSGLADS